MRSDLKIGIIVGVLLVVGLVAFIVSRGDETTEPAAPPTGTDNLTEPVTGDTTEPVTGDTTEPAVQQDVAPPAQQEVTPPVKQETTPPPVKQEVTPPAQQIAPPVDDDEVRQPQYYVVKEGDSLSRIAKSYYAEEKFSAVIQIANKELIKNIDMLQPGWRLRIPYPDEAAEIWKTVK